MPRRLASQRKIREWVWQNTCLVMRLEESRPEKTKPTIDKILFTSETYLWRLSNRTVHSEKEKRWNLSTAWGPNLEQTRWWPNGQRLMDFNRYKVGPQQLFSWQLGTLLSKHPFARTASHIPTYAIACSHADKQKWHCYGLLSMEEQRERTTNRALNCRAAFTLLV